MYTAGAQYLSSTHYSATLLLGLFDGCQVLVHSLLGVERAVHSARCRGKGGRLY